MQEDIQLFVKSLWRSYSISRRIVILSFLLINLNQCSSSLQTTTHQIDEDRVTLQQFISGTQIPKHDAWCKNNCFSIASCDKKFKQNYVDLQIRTRHTIEDGPGQDLVYDETFLGKTIAKQVFRTQFVFDISETALRISPCKVHVLDVIPAGRDLNQVFISFRLYDIVHDEIHELTKQIQNQSSLFYSGKVTSTADQLFGLVIPKWDFSIRMHYAIDIVGENDTKLIGNELVLNQGSERYCKDIKDNNEHHIHVSKYCEFESLFEQDIFRALSSINTTSTIRKGQIVVLFVKQSGIDGVIISCRFIPPIFSEEDSLTGSTWAKAKMDNLIEMIHDQNSYILYDGNVTFRIDPSWGISRRSSKSRTNSMRLNRSVPKVSEESYSRCKDTHRCSRGWNYYNQTSYQSTFSTQIFAGGEHRKIPLFADFEDWRQGTQGWYMSSCKDVNNGEQGCDLRIGEELVRNGKRPKGAHWSPFNFESLGPLVPSFNTTTNSGLVLNTERLSTQVERQRHWINDIETYLAWLLHEMNTTSLEAHTRFRRDILAEMFKTVDEYKHYLASEKQKLSVLENSQCINVSNCDLLFNTSNLQLTGVVNATGTLGFTSNGTEVAIWAFDSIDIGKEVKIQVTGQRAFSLLSKASVFIDTPLIAKPGTLGGFPGGISVSRIDRNISVCNETITHLPFVCDGDYPLLRLNNSTISNNINGPGSGSVRVYTYTVQTSGIIVHEVQSIATNAIHGQILSGGFILHFNGYSTPFIPHDTSAQELQTFIQDNLNAANVDDLDKIDRVNRIPGVGKVSVSRFSHSSSGGYEWRITFLTAIGNIGDEDSSPLRVTNLLNGIGASIDIGTIQNGNSIGGTFRVAFLGNITRPVDHDITSNQMKNVILQDLLSVQSVEVSRTGQFDSHCNDGMCKNSPQQAGGYVWTLVLTTYEGNHSPTSPTLATFDEEKSYSVLTVINNLTGCVNNECPNATAQIGSGEQMKDHARSRPFSIALGGGGAGYGGHGGHGFSNFSSGKPYGDESLKDLLGGSGGAIGLVEPYDTLMVGMPGRLRGGSGGGAIEIVAVNDIFIGPNSEISCNGEDGWRGFTAGGGGGSGGSILLSAFGVVNVKGILQVKGGDGATPLSRGNSPPARQGGGGSGGRIALFGTSVSHRYSDVAGGKCNCLDESSMTACTGQDGTLYVERDVSHSISIDENKGAAGTNHSLHLRPAEPELINLWFDPRHHYHDRSIEYSFADKEKPGRVSFFVKFEAFNNQRPIEGWGLGIGLKSEISESMTNVNESLFLKFGETIKHGFATTGGNENIHHNAILSDTTFAVEFDNWYYIDIRLDWMKSLYSIFIDNTKVVTNQNLMIPSIQSFGIFLPISNIDIWIDEIFVGYDATMNFQCPISIPTGKVEVETIHEDRGWKSEEIDRVSQFHAMTHHESHLSRRTLYHRPDDGGLVPFDGTERLFYSSDLKSEKERDESNSLKPDFLFTLHNSEFRSEKTRYFWYREHYNKDEFERADYITKDHLGGVAVCSTTDLVKWKNEGIMLHYANLTDMVSGSSGPFHVERPSVLFNNQTQKYVMWMIIDNNNRSLAMAGVATSDFPNGPFTLARSFYPDGNKTRDQIVHRDIDGNAYLIRTYYTTVEYKLPKAVMQPIWESVKKDDGSIHFPLTYHRAHYEPEYDDFHDIYLQRWRGEDKTWSIVCVNRETKVEREIPYGREGFNLCDNRLEYKKIIGQGSPMYGSSKGGVESRFLDPNDARNNIWKPSSVPNLNAQSWKKNYQEGSCGIYLTGDNFDRYDPNIPYRDVKDRGNCSNIADNPVHPTLPDKRIGPEEVIHKRRAKFVAISLLTDDYLDTTGVMTSYEGELEDGVDVSFLITNTKRSLFPTKNDIISSTHATSVHQSESTIIPEWDSNLHQYEGKHNDRSFYSLACVLDGTCPNNFE